MKSAAPITTVKAISAWCEERSISVEAVHLAGELNVIADRKSRAEADTSDWRLDATIFLQFWKYGRWTHVGSVCIFLEQPATQMP
ncbi:hypothetical protein DAPPUDRAFT_260190 [Daphnia pulex]|uniref:Uncharacterized protein n=1 Tax=Daphnia pulex TaxID=6669 RepID=E9HIP5_DAPPU|nr:hypothetical protein DAPPUDRAFT_260190 [Daphnia pulex]|eukprot:EFX68390.1 hypothetical protein DAPPUDRAFT_260190 [Daphnia pulex]